MHPSNDITFVRTGGLESLIIALKLDSVGSESGEMAAWTMSYFAGSSKESAEMLVEKGATEVLVEMLHSPDYCSREAAANACLTLLESKGKKKLVMEKLKDANAIPAFLSVLQDRQYNPRQQIIYMDALKSLMILSKSERYRREMLDACALETLGEGKEAYNKAVRDAASALERTMTMKSSKITLPWKKTDHSGRKGLYLFKIN